MASSSEMEGLKAFIFSAFVFSGAFGFSLTATAGFTCLASFELRRGITGIVVWVQVKTTKQNCWSMLTFYLI